MNPTTKRFAGRDGFLRPNGSAPNEAARPRRRGRRCKVVDAIHRYRAAETAYVAVAESDTLSDRDRDALVVEWQVAEIELVREILVTREDSPKVAEPEKVLQPPCMIAYGGLLYMAIADNEDRFVLAAEPRRTDRFGTQRMFLAVVPMRAGKHVVRRSIASLPMPGRDLAAGRACV